MTGFVTVDPKTLYLDQIVVAPEAWGSGTAEALLAEARRIVARRPRSAGQSGQCPRHPLLPEAGLRHYRRRQERSGRLTYWMKWRP